MPRSTPWLAVTTIKAGAIDYLTKPIRPGQLEVVVSQALELVNLRRQNAVLRGQVSKLSAERSVVGDSPALTQVLDAVRTAAPTRATVLLEGESGTGKELIARMLHDMSGRADEALVSVLETKSWNSVVLISPEASENSRCLVFPLPPT